jgi:hypothetical protein
VERDGWTDDQKKNHIRACATADDISAVSRRWTPGVSMKDTTKARTKPNLQGHTPIKTEAKVAVLSVVKGKQPQKPAGTKPSFVGRKFYKVGAVGSPGDYTSGKQHMLGTVMSLARSSLEHSPPFHPSSSCAW